MTCKLTWAVGIPRHLKVPELINKTHLVKQKPFKLQTDILNLQNVSSLGQVIPQRKTFFVTELIRSFGKSSMA